MWYWKKIIKKKFINFDSNIKKVEKKIGFKISKNQKIIEYSPKSHEYLRNISKNLISKNARILKHN